jgi:trimeric autotransporter adhesin
MATTLKLKNSVTTTATPSTLVQGEAAVNITDKKVWIGDASSTPVQILGAGAPVSGTTGTFSSTLTVTGAGSIQGLTVGRGGGAVSTNTAVGAIAGQANTTGADNTFIGRAAAYTNTTGSNNTAVGSSASYLNATGSYNTSVGKEALGYNTASNNTAVGYQSAYSNTTGTNNTALGMYALKSNSTGTNNTAVGYAAAFSTTTPAAIVAIGDSALYANTTGAYNTAIGYYALQANTTASYNTAVGYQSLYTNTTGTGTALGAFALKSNTTGSNNTALGGYDPTSGVYGALQSNTTGSYNIAVGTGALQANTTASNNTAVGYQAGYSNATATYNTFLGYTAGYSYTGTSDSYSTFIGSRAGYLTTSGVRNTFIGEGAGYTVTTGARNTILGRYDGNQGSLDIRTASNYIVLSDGDGNPRGYFNASGYFKANGGGTLQYPATTNAHELHTNVNGTDTLIVSSEVTGPYGVFVKWSGATPNNTSNYFLACEDSTNLKAIIYSNGTVSNRTGTYNTISDAKLKENIVDATPKLDKLMQTRVVNYNLIGDELKQIGFVAQELEQVFPSLVDNVPDLDENKEPTGEVTKGVKLTVMIPILVKAIQELKATVDLQSTEIASLKAQLNNGV